MTVSVALIGFGAIAQDLFAKVQSDPHLRVKQILVRATAREAAQIKIDPQTEVITSVEALDDDINFVLECAGHGALKDYGAAVLARGFDLGILSAGALSDDALVAELNSATAQSKAKVIVVPGAIGGIDAISAVENGGLTSVCYTGRKAPISWKGTPADAVCDLDTLTEPCEIFSGTAREAAQAFPKNANVVATVALAGLGFDDTTVRLIADPAVTRNTHRVQAVGDNVSFDFETSSGTLPNNPRTSALTSQSAYRALKLRAYPFST
jgi:aspartate dehydrogenase